MALSTKVKSEMASAMGKEHTLGLTPLLNLKEAGSMIRGMGEVRSLSKIHQAFLGSGVKTNFMVFAQSLYHVAEVAKLSSVKAAS
jgi:hypothetical protein